MIWVDRITSYNVCYTKLLRDITDADTTDDVTIKSANDFNVNMFDIRYGQLPITQNSKLELVANYFLANKTDSYNFV